MAKTEDRKRAERLVNSLATAGDPVGVAEAFIGLSRADLLREVRQSVLDLTHEVRKGADFGNQNLRLADVLAALDKLAGKE